MRWQEAKKERGERNMALIINGRAYELITVVARQFGVDYATLYRAVQVGEIPSLRLPRRCLVDLMAAQKFCHKRKKNAKPPTKRAGNQQ